MTMPPRTADTMSDAIAMSSPSGRMSKRARAAAEKRLAVALFGESGLIPRALPPQPSNAERLLQQAARLRDLAARGMRVRAFTKEADRLEAEAAASQPMEFATEPTEQGNQYVIPGCERDKSRGPKQMDLF